MIKPGPNYRMPKSIKRQLAVIVDPHRQGEIRRIMIQADLVGRQDASRKNHQKNGQPHKKKAHLDRGLDGTCPDG